MAGTLALAATLVVWQRTSEPPKVAPPRQIAPTPAPRAIRPPAPAPARAVPPPVPSASQTLPPFLPSAADLLDAEIEARFALHRAGACLGEPVELSIDSGRVLIRGTVSSLERKQTLTNLLQQARGFAWVALELNTLEDLPAAPAQPPGLPRSAVEASLPSRDRTFEKALARHFKSVFPAESDEVIRGRVTDTGNQALRKADAALAEAWALRRLQERFSTQPFSQVRPPAEVLLETMARDHIASLRARTAEIRELLTPVLSSLARPEAAMPGSGDVFLQVQRMQLLVDGLFGGQTIPGRTPEQASAELLLLSGHLAAELDHPENLIMSQFPGTRRLGQVAK
jgi:hypothetical protein